MTVNSQKVRQFELVSHTFHFYQCVRARRVDGRRHTLPVQPCPFQRPSSTPQPSAISGSAVHASMSSAFWSDACGQALGRPLHVLLDILYAFSSILVSPFCCFACMHDWGHGACLRAHPLRVHPSIPAALAAASL
jgi:hypothetical protein